MLRTSSMILLVVTLIATVPATARPAGSPGVYTLVYEGEPPLSVESLPASPAAPGGRLELVVRNLTVQEDDSVQTGDGTDVPVSEWSFHLGSSSFGAVLEPGEPPRWSLPMRESFCDDRSITSDQLASPLPVVCDGRDEDSGADGEAVRAGDGRPRTVEGEPFDADRRCGYQRDQNRVTLCFDGDGVPHRPPSPGRIDDNDLVAVYLIVPEDRVREYSVSVQGTVNDEDVRLLGAGGLAGLGKVIGQIQALTEDEVETFLAGEFGPFQAPSFSVTVHGPDELTRTTSFTVNPTYTAALRFAVADSRIRFNDYAVVPFFDGEPRIQNGAPEDGEAREYLTVVFYGWPWEERFWNGRDIRKPPADLWERVNPLVGFGLGDLGEEYLAGISLELTRGLDAFVALQFAQVEILGGNFAEGEVFAGDPGTLPTRQTWRDDVTYGLSVDLRIAADVLGSLFGGG